MSDPSAPLEWWRRAVIYEVYIRSFADGNGDGIGDIAGIRSRLPYLASLGVDGFWITPWNRSPMADAGYDVSDYRDIDPLFGTLDEARRLIREAHALGLRVIVDIVPNHTSSAHPWFEAALAAGRDGPARARFLFRDGRGLEGTEPPNNWVSAFGGPAWTPAPDDGQLPRQWYLHIFDAAQPDLNWENLDVRAEFESILRFWLETGVDGFRIDVAFLLVKDPALRDVPPGIHKNLPNHPYEDREEVHEIFRSWRRVLDECRPDGAFCGEIELLPDRTARYVRPDELHTAFNLHFAKQLWDVAAFRDTITATLASHAAVGAPPTWVVGNHDAPRPSFRLGRRPGTGTLDGWSRAATADQQRGAIRARAAALLAFALPGSAYVYQGDELGLPEVLDLAPHERQDPLFRRTGGREPGRDGARIPIAWSGDAPPFGFGPPGSAPWLPQPGDWAARTVEAQERDQGSTLLLYRRAIAIRRAHPGFAGDAFRWVDGPAGVLWFERGAGVQCAVNMTDETVALPAGRHTLLATHESAGDRLPADAAEWFITGQ
jgi:alpha-glucosidase